MFPPHKLPLPSECLIFSAVYLSLETAKLAILYKKIRLNLCLKYFVLSPTYFTCSSSRYLSSQRCVDLNKEKGAEFKFMALTVSFNKSCSTITIKTPKKNTTEMLQKSMEFLEVCQILTGAAGSTILLVTLTMPGTS